MISIVVSIFARRPTLLHPRKFWLRKVSERDRSVKVGLGEWGCSGVTSLRDGMVEGGGVLGG